MLSSLLRYCTLTALCMLPSGALPSEEKIMFLHIPKTGGTTVSTLLLNEYAADATSISVPPIVAYGNHRPLYDLSLSYNLDDYQLLVFLRDPVERIISEHFYCIEKHQGNPDILRAHGLSAKGDPIHTAKNLVCQFLSGLDPKSSRYSIEDHLKQAKANLQHQFAFVGITEKMDESVALLFTQYGWKIPEKIPHFNRSDNRYAHIDETAIATIKENNWADIELYQFACDLYERQKNRIASQESHLKPNELALNEQWLYTFNQKLSGYGWSPRVNHGLECRWATVDNAAALDIGINAKTDYTMRFAVLVQPQLLPAMRIKINHYYIQFKPIGGLTCKSEVPDFEWIFCEATIPQYMFKPQEKIRITFTLEPLFSPIFIEPFETSEQNQNVFANFQRGHFACGFVELKPVR